MIKVLVQITSAGTSFLPSSTFSVIAYNGVTPTLVLATGVPLSATFPTANLTAGIEYTNVPIGSTHIRIQATNGPSGCTNNVLI